MTSSTLPNHHRWGSTKCLWRVKGKINSFGGNTTTASRIRESIDGCLQCDVRGNCKVKQESAFEKINRSVVYMCTTLTTTVKEKYATLALLRFKIRTVVIDFPGRRSGSFVVVRGSFNICILCAICMQIQYITYVYKIILCSFNWCCWWFYDFVEGHM